MYKLVRDQDNIPIPSNAEEFQLYDNPGVEDCAAVIHRALIAGAAEIRNHSLRRTPTEVMKSHLDPVLKEHRDYGTGDSEVFYAVKCYLDQVFLRQPWVKEAQALGKQHSYIK